MVLLGIAAADLRSTATQPEFFQRKPEPVDPEIAATVTHRIAKGDKA